jgi:ACS family hexuronate transporter-like MFS transporter
LSGLASSRTRYGILALVTSAQAGSSLVQQGLGSLGPFLTSALALSHAQLGIVFGMMMAGATAAVAISGLAVDKYGERRMILISGLLMGFALIAGAFAHSYLWLVAWMTLAGVGYAASTPAGGRAVLLWFARDRGLAMGIRQMGVPLGGFLGSLILPAFASAGGYARALLAGGIVTALPSILAAIWYREPAGHVHVSRTLRELLGSMHDVARDARLVYIMLTCMVLVVAQSNMLTFFALTLVRDGGFDVAVAAAGLAVAQIGAGIGRVGWGALSDRVFAGDRIVPLMFSCGIVTLAAAAVAFVPRHAVAIAFPVAFVLGFSASGWNGLFSAAQVEIGGVERAGSALGVALTGVFGMGIVAPPLFGALADARGFHTAWLSLAALAVLGLVPALLARRAMARHGLKLMEV